MSDLHYATRAQELRTKMADLHRDLKHPHRQPFMDGKDVPAGYLTMSVHEMERLQYWLMELQGLVTLALAPMMRYSSLKELQDRMQEDGGGS